MLCECGQREATIHELVIKSGKKIEKHLCEQCAKEQGLQPTGPGSIGELLTKYITTQSTAAPGESKPAQVVTCRVCGLTYAQFKQAGLLGCPECYRTFDEQIAPLLERAHEGAARHVGKVPRRALAASRLGGRALEEVIGEREERAKRLSLLQRQLQESISAEQFERAAQIRDEIRRLSELEADPARE